MSFDNTPVIFLEIDDFKNGVLSYKGKPITTGVWFIMIQASFCGYCTKSKPAFIEAARQSAGKGVVFATIHSDSENAPERDLGKEISSITGLSIPGIPFFVVYNAATRKFTKYDGERDVNGFLSIK